MVAAEQVDVVVTERGEPLDVGVVDGVAVAPESRKHLNAVAAAFR